MKTLIDAALHFKDVQVIRCDIKAGLIRRSDVEMG
jgi:hypothetical protein